ncbi:hypothetical protein DL546_000005, partial [Coniochaeta pulveracea]
SGEETVDRNQDLEGKGAGGAEPTVDEGGGGERGRERGGEYPVPVPVEEKVPTYRYIEGPRVVEGRRPWEKEEEGRRERTPVGVRVKMTEREREVSERGSVYGGGSERGDGREREVFYREYRQVR